MSEPRSTAGSEWELNRGFAEALSRVETEYRPLGAIGFAIARAAADCRDQSKGLIQASTEGERLEREIYMFFEFIYFFMHMSMHQASTVISEARLESLQDLLAMLIPSTAINSYFYHWPEDRKENMIGEFIESLNEREAEYSTVAMFDTPLQGIERSVAKLQALFGRLAYNVANIAIDDENTLGAVLEISHFSIAEWTKMRLGSLLADAAESK